MRPHAEVCDDLRDAYLDLAELESACIKLRRDAWDRSQESTVTARDRSVSFVTADLDAEIVKQKGIVRSLETELRAIEWAVTHAER